MQVLANLITSAMKFAPPGGAVRVRAEGGNQLRFAVSDTGSGISGNLLEAIFGKDDRRGLGLGLYIYISRRIVEAHGGRIWAESKMGEGSRLCFRPAAIGQQVYRREASARWRAG